jgi:hypothetical protein
VATAGLATVLLGLSGGAAWAAAAVDRSVKKVQGPTPDSWSTTLQSTSTVLTRCLLDPGFPRKWPAAAYLKALPVDELKVDRSFVGQMAINSSDAVIVRPTPASDLDRWLEQPDCRRSKPQRQS